MLSAFAGCKTEKAPEKITPNDTNVTETFDIPKTDGLEYDIEFPEYISLPELASLEINYITIPNTAEIIDQYIYAQQLARATRTEVTDRAVASGDIATINYKIVFFGTDEVVSEKKNVEISVGKYMAIPELEDALVGMAKGETKQVDIVYPADRTTSKALANAKTTYTIEMVKIETAVLPELNTETIKSFGLGVDSYEALREYFAYQIDQQNSLNKQDAVYNALVRGSELISMPSSEHSYYLDMFDKNTEAKASSMGITVDEVISTDYGTKDEYENKRNAYAEENVYKDLIIYALKDKYGVEVTEEEFNTALNITYKDQASSLGITTLKDFYDKMGASVYKMELTYQVMEAAAKDVPDKQ